MINHPNRGRKVAATSNTEVPAKPAYDHDADYTALRASIFKMSQLADTSCDPVFKTDAKGLYDAFLDALPNDRQRHNCHECRRFVKTFGGLVCVDATGKQRPVMWDGDLVPAFYRRAIKAVAKRVVEAEITSPLSHKGQVWGLPSNDGWEHMCTNALTVSYHRSRSKTPNQVMAAKRENYTTVFRALNEMPEDAIQTVLRTLQNEELSRSEKYVAPVEWLLNLQRARMGTRNLKKAMNIVWRAVATAPEGYCHPRSSSVGELVQWVVEGVAEKEIQRRWKHMRNPLTDQRPQVAPKAGNIQMAETLASRLDIERSLQRRFARLEDLETIWKHQYRGLQPVSTAGVFRHITPKDNPGVPRAANGKYITVTWVKFASVILPKAEALQMYVPDHGNFIGLTTAVYPDAPPIMKWDRDEERNPVAWYVYSGGSYARNWQLTLGWTRITAVTLLPPMWGSQPKPHLGSGAVLVLDGAKDLHLQSAALFPESLKQDLYGIRATIEAFSKANRLADPEKASACGYDLRNTSGHAFNVKLLAYYQGAWSGFLIDRWD